MARKKIISEEEAFERYDKLYQEGREAFLKYGTDPITEKVSDDAQFMYFQLAKNEQRYGQIIPSVEDFARRTYNKAIKRYQEKLENWTPESGEPKPKKPHRDSFSRYLDQFARSQTRRYATAQADAIIKGGFTYEEEVYVLNRKGEKIPLKDEETGEELFDKDTGEALYKTRIRTRKVTRNDVYYRPEEFGEKFFWDPIRKRRQELIEKQKKLDKEELSKDAWWQKLAETIAREFFGSAPKKRK